MPDYTIGVYDFDPYFTFSRTVNGEITYAGPASSETTVVITDNGTGADGDVITDSSETATGTITINGNTSTGVDISAEESWTILNVDTGETFQIITFEIESGPAAGYYTVSEQPLVPGATYRTLEFNTDPTAADATFNYSEYVTDIADGTVDGTDGDDVIDDSYSGDPQGEEVDNLDGGSVSPVTLDLNWDAEGADETDLFGGVSQDTGGIQVDVSFTNDGIGTEWSVESSQTQYVGPGESFDPNSALLLYGNGPTGDTSTTQVDFSSVAGSGFEEEVTNVQFRINDIDSATGAFRDQVTVRAYDADGNEIEVQFTIGGDETLSGNTVTGGDNANNESDLDGSVLITIPGPVAYFTIDYDQAGTGTQAIYVTDITFDAVPVGGNVDVIDAGAGNDSIDSGLDTDTVFGGTGNDTINASEDDDTLYGGDDADTFQMGDGLGSDSIVGGEGGTDSDTIDASALTAGVTVTFTGDETGNVTGVGTDAAFSEIENLVLTDQDDVVDGTASNQSMSIDAGAGDDILTGGTGDDTLNGGDGDDTINLLDGFGSDVIDGGSGGETEGDTLDASELTGGTTVTTSGDGTGTITDGVDTASFADIETIETGSNDDTIDASADTTGMTLIGGGGDDSIDGGDGNDVIYGDGGEPNEPGVWLYEYYDLDPTGDPRTLEQAGFTVNDGRNHEDDPTTTGYTDTIAPTAYDTGDDYALKFTTQITITAGGDYTFGTVSDDGSQMYINGQLVVDNDGHHGMVPASGTITLPPGDYIVEIVYYENNGGNGLTASVSGPDTGNVQTDLTGYPALSPVPESGSDTLNGGQGDDTIYGGDDDDTILLSDGFGSDVIFGGEGGIDQDTLDTSDVTSGVTVDFTGGEEGTVTDGTDTASFEQIEEFVLTGQADTINGALADATMTVFAGAGDDTIMGGSVTDFIYGGTGADTINGGGGDDTLFGGDDADTFVLVDTGGTDSIDGGAGGTDADVIDMSGLTTGVDVTFTDGEDGTIDGAGTDATFTDIETLILTDLDDVVDGSGSNQSMTVDAGAGSDTITGGSGADVISGEAGADTINGGAGNDTLFGGDDADTFVLTDGGGNDSIDGGSGGTDADTIDMSSLTSGVNVTFTDGEDGTVAGTGTDATFTEIETLILTAEDDVVNGAGSNQAMTVFGGAGADSITGGSGADVIDGGIGDDTLAGGSGNDTLTGGQGNDTITVGDGDAASGGDGDDTFVINQTDTGTGDINIVGGEGDETNGDTLNFNGLLDTGTLVITDDDDANGGLTGYAFLLDGTRVNFSEIENIICFARGTQILTHSGEVLIEELAEGDQIVSLDHGLQQIRWIGSRVVPASGDFAPITIAKGVLGTHSDLTVSPQHRMLVTGPVAELLFGESEVLVPAKHLLSWDGVYRAQMETVEYFHILFDTHQVIHANGALSESFHPGEQAMDAVSEDARTEILTLFPELADHPAAYGPAARFSLKGYEAEVLGRGMAGA